MELDELESVLSRLVRRGIVTDVNKKKRRARVRFEDEGLPSGELRVLSSPPFIPKVGETQKTEPAAGGSGDAAFAEHSHEVRVTPWLPRVNDTVLVLYLPAHDSDGYILGRIEEGTN